MLLCLIPLLKENPKSRWHNFPARWFFGKLGWIERVRKKRQGIRTTYFHIGFHMCIHIVTVGSKGLQESPYNPIQSNDPGGDCYWVGEHTKIYCILRPAATRNAQRSVPNADPQRKGPMWISSSIDGVDAFSPGRRKHPKEPYVLKGHVTSNHGTYCSTAWQGLGVNLWGRKKHLEGRLLLMEEILHHGG